MARYRWTKNGFVDATTGERMAIPERDGVCLPMIVVEDFQPFESPATGKMITSRAEHRYDLAASNCRLLEPDESPTKGRLKNRTFTEKRGLKVSDEYRDYDSSIKAKEAT